jgi:DNA-binding transcriptional LysR family regulator
MRNLDLTTLRSFVAVADHGGVTRAAAMLNLTQSAVSMQLKRLEELLGLDLLDRSNRRIALTANGDQLLSYARRMVDLNDEIVSRLTDQVFEGELVLGVPHDIVYPLIPRVLQEFNARYPRMKVQLHSSYTSELKEMFGRGKCDVILTTETGIEPGGETLSRKPLRWIGAPGGHAWRQRPLRLAFSRQCTFRPKALKALNEAGIGWEIAVETESDRTIEATVSADLAVHTMIEGTKPPHLEQIAHAGALPDLPMQNINLYGADQARGEAMDELLTLLRQSFRTW